MCVTQEDRVRTVEVDPVVECRHSQQERCHLTYVTAFTPSRQQVCKAGRLAGSYGLDVILCIEICLSFPPASIMPANILDEGKL